MKGLLLRYNKVHNNSLYYLSNRIKKDIEIIWGDLSFFGSEMDLAPLSKVERYLSLLSPFDFVVVGDVFWKTGQNICRVCRNMNVPVFFMQHGQWIYIVNKQSLNYYPDHTLLFGDNVKKMCSSWEYAKHSKIHVVGCPRYDEALSNGLGSYVYFSPPVIEELIHNKPSGRIRFPFLNSLEKLIGIDNYVPIIIHPHYREARIDWLKQRFPKAQFADPALDPMKLIRGSAQVLASRNSTVVLDAIAHEKPVVLLDFPENDVCFFKRGYFGEFATEINNKEELIEVLSKPRKLNKTNYQLRAKPYIYLGNASERILNLIMKEV